jgi:hypothetical protein
MQHDLNAENFCLAGTGFRPALPRRPAPEPGLRGGHFLRRRMGIHPKVIRRFFREDAVRADA